MPPLYSAIGRAFRIGPLDATALVAELQKRAAGPNTTVICHLGMGDRAAPLAHFPELNWTNRGALLASSHRYRTLWLRFWASVIDTVVIAPVLICALVVDAPLFSWAGWASLVVLVLLTSTYFVYFHARGGQTLGKKMMGVRVVHADGEGGITWGQSLRRESPILLINGFLFAVEAAIIASGIEHVPAGILASYAALDRMPTLWRFVDPAIALTNHKRRTIHDLIGGTVVIRCDATSAVSPPSLPTDTAPPPAPV